MRCVNGDLIVVVLVLLVFLCLRSVGVVSCNADGELEEVGS